MMEDKNLATRSDRLSSRLSYCAKELCFRVHGTGQQWSPAVIDAVEKEKRVVPGETQRDDVPAQQFVDWCGELTEGLAAQEHVLVDPETSLGMCWEMICPSYAAQPSAGLARLSRQDTSALP